MTFTQALAAAKAGLETWRSKPHNAKWWRHIDGTPIPNDLCVCIAQAIADIPLADEGVPIGEVAKVFREVIAACADSPLAGVSREDGSGK